MNNNEIAVVRCIDASPYHYTIDILGEGAMEGNHLAEPCELNVLRPFSLSITDGAGDLIYSVSNQGMRFQNDANEMSDIIQISEWALPTYDIETSLVLLHFDIWLPQPIEPEKICVNAYRRDDILVSNCVEYEKQLFEAVVYRQDMPEFQACAA